MTKISAKIVADSTNEFGNRITTMEVTFPRFILAELNTHRMMSRNSASSRAIPFEKMVEAVKTNPFIPIAWQRDHKGMQGVEYITNEEHLVVIEQDWLEARDQAVKYASRLSDGFIADKDGNEDSVTKQLCNRLLEPFMWHTVLITATEWENFFYLRCPKYTDEAGKEFRSKKDFVDKSLDPTQAWMSDYDSKEWFTVNKGQAEIHMMALAEAMWDAYNESTPKQLKAGEWHMPFMEGLNAKGVYLCGKNVSEFIKVSTAMCARVSYTVVGEEGKEPNFENDVKLHDRLAESGHWSPFEHCARAMNTDEYYNSYNGKLKELELPESTVYIPVDDNDLSTCGWSGNFRGFVQYRKTFANENRQ